MHPASPPATLGADLRALRRTRGLTLTDLSERLGRSTGWLSQVERDLSAPSITDLRHLAAALEVPVSMLAQPRAVLPEEEGIVVRAGQRREIGSRASGLVEELLSPDLTDDFEMVHSTFEPFSEIGETVTRPTQELGYLLSGRLEMTIGPRQFTIHPGDSFRIKGEPFRWSNPYPDPAVAVWVIAPPVY